MGNLRRYVKQFIYIIAAILFWFLIWYFFAKRIDNKIFLPTPKETIEALFTLGARKSFWEIIAASFIRIVKGFLSAVLVGSILAVISSFIKLIKCLIEPLMRMIKAVPVASFTILALLWINSKNLSILISFMMVLPVIYINVLQGFENVDRKMLELARVYNISMISQMRFLYIPSVFPAFMAACRIGLGYCFKSGVAAEVIGRPTNSIGEELYLAKLYLMTDELFAWTIVIILLSIFFEGICIYILNRVCNRIKNISKLSLDKEVKMSDKEVKMLDKQVKMPDTDKIEFRNATVVSNHKKKNTTTEQEMIDDIKISNLSKQYGKNTVFQDFSISAARGERLCIMGESGAGKTTLLRIMMGLEKADSGEIKIRDGLKVRPVFQEDRLIEDADVYTNLYFAMDREIKDQLCRQNRNNGITGIFKQIDRHLEMVGLKGLGAKSINELSGGMKRRVAMIRAVINSPDLLILDEAFNGLDIDTKNIVINYICNCCNDKTIIMVTHNLTEAEKMGAIKTYFPPKSSNAKGH